MEMQGRDSCEKQEFKRFDEMLALVLIGGVVKKKISRCKYNYHPMIFY